MEKSQILQILENFFRLNGDDYSYIEQLPAVIEQDQGICYAVGHDRDLVGSAQVADILDCIMLH